MKIQNIQELMVTGMTYTLNFEEQVGQAAPRMAEASSNPELKELFSKTQTKSKEYGQRIEQVFEKLGRPVQKNENNIAKAMIQEVEEMIKNIDAGPVRDAALIVAANQQQSYRVSSYGSLSSYAKLIGKEDAVKALDESVKDSKQGDQKFTSIAEKSVNQQAKAA